MDCVHHWKIETPNGRGASGGRRVLAGSAVFHLQKRFVAFKVYQVQRRGGSYYGFHLGGRRKSAYRAIRS